MLAVADEPAQVSYELYLSRVAGRWTLDAAQCLSCQHDANYLYKRRAVLFLKWLSGNTLKIKCFVIFIEMFVFVLLCSHEGRLNTFNPEPIDTTGLITSGQ